MRRKSKAELLFLEDLDWLIRDPRGMRMVARLMRESGYFDPPHEGSAERLNFNAGRRHLCISFSTALVANWPDRLILPAWKNFRRPAMPDPDPTPTPAPSPAPTPETPPPSRLVRTPPPTAAAFAEAPPPLDYSGLTAPDILHLEAADLEAVRSPGGAAQDGAGGCRRADRQARRTAAAACWRPTTARPRRHRRNRRPSGSRRPRPIPRIGGQAFEANYALANKVLNEFADEGFRAWLDETGLRHFPPLLRMFAGIAKATGEAPLVARTAGHAGTSIRWKAALPQLSFDVGRESRGEELNDGRSRRRTADTDRYREVGWTLTGCAAKTIELLSKKTEILEDIPMDGGQFATGHRITQRTSLPTPTTRMFNQGHTRTKSTRAQIDETCAMYSDYCEVDAALLASATAAGPFATSEDAAHVEGFAQQMAFDSSLPRLPPTR